jgi:hypothetical protein
LALRLLDRVSRREPVDRELIIRVSEAWAGPARQGGLSAIRIGIPGDVQDRAQLFRQGSKFFVDEPRLEALLKSLSRELALGHSLANVGRHGTENAATRENVPARANLAGL